MIMSESMKMIDIKGFHFNDSDNNHEKEIVLDECHKMHILLKMYLELLKNLPHEDSNFKFIESYQLKQANKVSYIGHYGVSLFLLRS